MNRSSFAGLYLPSRRNFLRTTATTLAAAGAMGAGLAPYAAAEKKTEADPKPIPGGSPLLGGAFHVYGPGARNFDPPDSEPITITDFKGFAGVAYISGSVVRTERATGKTATLPFVDADMRFMQGIYRGVDGRIHQGTFGFI